MVIDKLNDLPEDILYEYTPRPPKVEIPPISRHEFELALASCNTPCLLAHLHECLEPPDGNIALDRIPKRNGAFALEAGGREFVWGILAQHSISYILVFMYHALVLAGLFAFWIWWQVRHPGDMQNATVPVMVFVALLSLVWSSAAVLKTFRGSDG